MRIHTWVFIVSSLSSASSLLYMQPYSLRNLFYTEETVIMLLQSVERFYSSARLTEYLNSCAPRLQELALLDNLMDEVETHLNTNHRATTKLSCGTI